MTGSSTWAGGTVDTATTLQNAVDEKRAEHINGVAAFAVALQGKLGSAASLIGEHNDLASRLAIGIGADGTLTSAEPGDLCVSCRLTKTGWLVCDGAEYNRSTFSDLFDEIGTAYGPGNGSTTFNVPDFRGRVPIGVGTGVGGGSSGVGLPAGGSTLGTISRGSWKGEDAHGLTGNESGIQAHRHQQTGAGAVGGSTITVAQSNLDSNQIIGVINFTENVAAANAIEVHNNIQPVMGVNFFIKV